MKNMKYFFIGLFAVSLFTFQISAQDAENVKKQIEEDQASFMESFNNGNAEAVAETYAADAVVLPPHKPEVSGRKAIEKLYQGFMDSGNGTLKLSTVNTDVFGNIAVNHLTWEFEGTTEDGNEIKNNGKAIVVYKEQGDGNWLVIYDIWNSDLPLPTSN